MVKVISLSDEIYEKLKEIKRNRSFSEIIAELIERRKKRKGILKFAGAFKNNAEYWDKALKEIYEDRKKFKLREYKL